MLINGTLKTDPTRTQSIRDTFEADMVRRFTLIKRAIIDAIVTKDVFGIARALKVNIEYEQFAFDQSDQKVAKFMSWLQEQQKKDLLTFWSSVKAKSGEEPWTNTYIKRAYQSGMSQAESKLKKSGHAPPLGLSGKGGAIETAFNQPFHADRVALLYARTFEDLKTVANVMDSKIRNALIDGLTNVLPLGMVAGKNPEVIAKDIAALATDQVNKVGIVRGRLIARTEVIRAHHQATCNEYEKWGVKGVTVDAEWLTAGFNACPECSNLQGHVFTIEEIRPLIPAHPNCRCAAIPVVKTVEKPLAPPPPPVPTITQEILNNAGKSMVFGKSDILEEGATLNGIKLEKFDMDIQYPDFGTKELPYEPVIDTPKNIRSGVVIVESDGRVWLQSNPESISVITSDPISNYKNYMDTQEAAVRAAYKQSGLGIQITGYLGDYEKAESIDRIYIARRVGGNPLTAKGTPFLSPIESSKLLVSDSFDQLILNQFGDLRTKALAMGHGNLEQGLKMMASHKISTVVQQYVKAMVEDKPVKTSVLQFVQSLPKEHQNTILELIQSKVDVAKLKAGATAKFEEMKATMTLPDAAKAYAEAVLKGDSTPSGITEFVASLSKSHKEAFNAQVADLLKKAKAAKPLPVVPVSSPATAIIEKGKLNIDDFVKIGDQLGSNPGGVYKNNITEEKWYIKKPNGAYQSINEVMTADLYKLAGIDMPEVHLITMEDGSTGIASKWIDGLEVNKAKLISGKLPGVFDGFGVDAWLANWDVVGQNYDNLKVLDGLRALRVDTGGGLLYRAQGGEKGSMFGNIVSELESLRNPSTNTQTASVFKKITEEDIKASVRRVLSISDAEIRRVVEQTGAELPPEMRKHIADTLIARKADLASKFPELVVETPAALPLDAAARITDQEFEFIKSSRINGYVMPTDAGDIEDHHVLVWHETTAEKKVVTMAQFKLTPEALKVYEQTVVKGLAPIDMARERVIEAAEAFHDKAIEAIKGIASQSNLSKGEGGLIRQKDIDRVDELHALAKKVVEKADAASYDYEKWVSHYANWIKALDDAIKVGVDGPAKWDTGGKTLSKFVVSIPSANATASSWMAEDFPYWVKKLKNGYATRTGGLIDTSSAGKQILNGYVRTLDDGTIIRFRGTDNHFAFNGMIDIEIQGGDKVAANRVFEVMNQIGVKATRATAADTEELYLRQSVYQINSKKYVTLMDKLENMTDQEQRVTTLKKFLNKEFGVDDVTTLPGYNPEGLYQAFGQGRRNFYRPDVDTSLLWQQARSEVLLYHVNTGGKSWPNLIEAILDSGGSFVSSIEKLRRGFRYGGKSPERDMVTGGANYFFTSLMKKDNSSGVGFYWNTKMASRLDAISYRGDMFGETTGNTVVNNRIGDPSKFKEMTGNRWNETNFKNSLSIFDGLEKIVVGDEDIREKVIQTFKKHRVLTLGGRPIEQMILAH